MIHIVRLRKNYQDKEVLNYPEFTFIRIKKSKKTALNSRKQNFTIEQISSCIILFLVKSVILSSIKKYP